MEKKEMSMAQRRAAGLLWVDTGENMDQQRKFCKNSLPFAEKGSGSSRLLHLLWEIRYLSEKELMSTQI